MRMIRDIARKMFIPPKNPPFRHSSPLASDIKHDIAFTAECRYDIANHHYVWLSSPSRISFFDGFAAGEEEFRIDNGNESSCIGDRNA